MVSSGLVNKVTDLIPEEELDEDMRCLYESKINDIFEILKIMGREVKCAGMVKLPNKEYKYYSYSII